MHALNDVPCEAKPSVLQPVLETFGRVGFIASARATTESVLGDWAASPEAVDAVVAGFGPRAIQRSVGSVSVLGRGVVVIDNALQLAVARSLAAFCQQSTLYFDQKAGHLGAYLSDGFASGLLLQVAASFQRSLAGLLAPHALTQLWAYKYDSEIGRGIRVHADQGVVSLNCWLTTDVANQWPDKGGLKIYYTENWARNRSSDFSQSNQDFRALHAEIEALEAAGDLKLLEVPHRANRCLLFRSELLHETGAIRFRPGYANRRINLTFMYGMSSVFSADAPAKDKANA